LSGKEFEEDGAATANAQLARCLCVLEIKKFPRVVDRRRVSLQGTHSSDKYEGTVLWLTRYIKLHSLVCSISYSRSVANVQGAAKK